MNANYECAIILNKPAKVKVNYVILLIFIM